MLGAQRQQQAPQSPAHAEALGGVVATVALQRGEEPRA